MNGDTPSSPGIKDKRDFITKVSSVREKREIRKIEN